MRQRSSRRRLRLRRKRKGETFSKALDAPDALDVVDAIDDPLVVEVVGRLGCCVVEAIGSAAVLLALLTVPAYLLLHRVT